VPTAETLALRVCFGNFPASLSEAKVALPAGNFNICAVTNQDKYSLMVRRRFDAEAELIAFGKADRRNLIFSKGVAQAGLI